MPHAFQIWRGTWLQERYLYPIIQSVSGHRSLEVLEEYLAVKDEQVRGAIATLSQISYVNKSIVPGEITELDIDLTAASGATIVGLNTTIGSSARQAANAEGVDVREYNIIYKLREDIQGAMEELLEAELVEEPLG
jgi:translation initiation factor IF-2